MSYGNKKEENTYVTEIGYTEKFRAAAVKPLIQEVLKERLEGATYSAESTSLLSKAIADELREKLKEQAHSGAAGAGGGGAGGEEGGESPAAAGAAKKGGGGISNRYKFMVNVVLGEQRGQGIRMGNRCFWDEDTDAFACETYHNDSIFCVATAYGIYMY